MDHRAYFFEALGTGDKNNRYMWTKVMVNSGVLTISAGWSHSLKLMKGESVWGVSTNYFMELGKDDTIKHPWAGYM
jgi:hypothetical protein